MHERCDQRNKRKVVLRTATKSGGRPPQALMPVGARPTQPTAGGPKRQGQREQDPLSQGKSQQAGGTEEGGAAGRPRLRKRRGAHEEEGASRQAAKQRGGETAAEWEVRGRSRTQARSCAGGRRRGGGRCAGTGRRRGKGRPGETGRRAGIQALHLYEDAESGRAAHWNSGAAPIMIGRQPH